MEIPLASKASIGRKKEIQKKRLKPFKYLNLTLKEPKFKASLKWELGNSMGNNKTHHRYNSYLKLFQKPEMVEENAILVIRVIRSFPHRNIRNIVLKSVPLKTTGKLIVRFNTLDKVLTKQIKISSSIQSF